MKAILARSFGTPDVLVCEEVPDPVPSAGQLRIRVHAVGVNPYDTYMLTGNYAIHPPLPYMPGADAAGVVDAVGDGVDGWREGDRVYIGGTVHGMSFGASAELVLCAPEQVHPLPERVSFAQGAALNVPYVTAWESLVSAARVRAGEHLFIHGASGGVGLAAAQIARGMGLTVIGSAGTDEGRALVGRWAHSVVDHKAEGYMDEVARMTGGRGPDVILEMLANVNLDADLALIARHGRIIVVGSRGRVEIDPRRIMGKQSTVTGAHLWSVSPDARQRAHAGIHAGLESGVLEPVIAVELPFEQAAEAHARVMAPGAGGKIVLVP